MITNFCPSVIDTAMQLLAEGFVLVEVNGDMTACVEQLALAYGLASSMNANDIPANLHFPNGEFIAADQFIAQDISGKPMDFETFEEIGRRLDLLAACEELDEMEEIVHCLIVETGEHLDVRRGEI